MADESYGTIPRFRIDPTTKTPLTTHGFKDASTGHAEPLETGRWGIPTGRVTGVFVLDVDSYKPSGYEWLVTHDENLRHIPYVTTAHGGRHYFYRWEEGQVNGKIAEGVDLRGEGGYVVFYGSWPTDPSRLSPMPREWWHHGDRPKTPYAPADYGDVDWASILGPHGWGTNGKFWVHPDSTNRRTATITTHGNLYMHGTTCDPFSTGESYTPFKAFELLNPGKTNPYARIKTPIDPGVEEAIWAVLMAEEPIEAISPSGNGHPPTLLPSFPLEVLPDELRRFVETAAESVCCSVEMLAPMMLAAAGALIGRSRSCGIKDDWQEYPALWVCAVAEAGMRKTPAIKRALIGPRAVQKDLDRDYAHDRDDWDGLDRKDQKGKQPPVYQQLLCSDVTVEAMARVIRSHPHGILLARDELSGWARSMGQYKSRGSDDRQKWLEMWSGGDLRVSRVGMDIPLVVEDPFVAMVGGIQPTALIDLLNPSADDGMIYRFLMVAPAHVPESARTPSVAASVRAAWEKAARRLYRLPGARPLGTDQEGTGRLVAILEDIYRHKKAVAGVIHGFWGKADAHLLRIAVVLTCLRHVCDDAPDVVTAAIAEDACSVLDFFLAHTEHLVTSRRVFESRDFQRPTPAKGQELIDWLRSQGGGSTRREAMWRGPFQRMTSRDVETVLSTLAAQGLLEVRNEKRGRVTITLNYLE